MPAKKSAQAHKPLPHIQERTLSVEDEPVSESHTVTQSVVPSAPPVPQAVELDDSILTEVLESGSEDPAIKKKNKALYSGSILFTALVCGIALLLGVAAVRELRPQNPTPTQQPTSIATPTPTAIPKSSVTFEVLNGSGVAGRAAKAAAQLSLRGYTVVGTGNADKTAESKLFVDSRVPPSLLTTLLDDISSLFRVASSAGTPVDSTASAVLILGTR